ncbi:hypothetical protein [Prescottella equi]|uniref:hypothetical protein n=1 Tax=Rhodococcus hoagii TaxID=43767 RepID=UPI0007CD682A|nr:hypothetical protein [Prescottella equi]
MTDTTEAIHAFPVADGAARLGQTEAWYLRQLRNRKLPGHKIGRKWMLTEDDIRQALELTAIAATPKYVDPAGLSQRSRQHLNRQRRTA